MGSYDEIEIEDMKWDEKLLAYTYTCPCGDFFQITMDELRCGEEVAHCPSCSLYITVVYDPADFEEGKAPPPTITASVPAHPPEPEAVAAAS